MNTAPPTSMRQISGFSRIKRPKTLMSPPIAVSTTAPTLCTMLRLRSRKRSSPIAIASVTQTCSANSSSDGGEVIRPLVAKCRISMKASRAVKRIAAVSTMRSGASSARRRRKMLAAQNEAAGRP
ncbi:hypothetical protein ABH979_002426 [Bradyrhizobium ottawaense]